MKRFDVLVPLDLCVDLIARLGDVKPQFGQVEQLIPDYQIELGGSAVIFAVQAAKLGLNVAGVGRIGDDLMGRFVLEKLQSSGVNTDWIAVEPSVKTGMGIALNRGNDRAILTYSGSIDATRPEDLSMERVLSARHLHIASYFLMKQLQAHYAALLPAVTQKGVTVSLDTNWDPDGNWDSGLSRLLPYTTLFFPNREEARRIAHTENDAEAQKRLQALTPLLAIKDGGRGAAVYTRGKAFARAALPVTVCDTIGAGDNFDAGFVYGFLKGFSPKQCLLSGILTGGKSTEKPGGTAAQLTGPQLTELLDRYFAKEE